VLRDCPAQQVQSDRPAPPVLRGSKEPKAPLELQDLQELLELTELPARLVPRAQLELPVFKDRQEQQESLERQVLLVLLARLDRKDSKA
jgi:hypothetical protein